ncbi:cross-pathway control WD-repeat protein cpc2 [Mitosporidium daphniae]|uniref:Uncharacterized protein n=1 Tax=Mitosporidium daphniae TaxID=1485682 RepID=A0A098VW90_9MICR|nr:uncharacterized protein DI09_106p90 [Mitosporidium daphniae]KGG53185.1 hypothetical protein DI09_106p90 [Mitosporidium daphniae]|eukprot:XP_013239621.1 uncharacterized protein DI09_106p90 [Mitosporidium daphniae]
MEAPIEFSNSANISLCGTLKGHTDSVTAIACPTRPDANYVVSASRDKTVMIWNLTRNMENYGVPKKALKGHNHFIQDMTLSPDGEYALTASWDKTLRLWDLNVCATTSTFVGHKHDVMTVSLSPDNRQIVSGSRDKSIKVWNIKGECRYTIDDAHSEWVSSVRFSPNAANPLLVCCGWDKVVKVWDTTSMKLTANHLGHSGYINTSMISPDGSLCATGGKDGKVMLWDLNERQFLYSRDAGDEINALVFSPSRYWLTAATASGIMIWDLETKNLVAELTAEFPSLGPKSIAPSCVSLAWSADGTTLYSGFTDGIIRVYQVNA